MLVVEKATVLALNVFRKRASEREGDIFGIRMYRYRFGILHCCWRLCSGEMYDMDEIVANGEENH